MHTRSASALALLLFPLITPQAQRPVPPEPAFSMGQPSRFQPYGALSYLTARGPRDRLAIVAGLHRAVTNPVMGLFGVAGELALSRPIDGQALVGRARLLATMPVFGLATGVDVAADGDVAPILTFQTAIRRGGLLGRGTMLRVDWLPKGRDMVGLGLHVPIGNRFAGRTRSRDTDADLSVRERTAFTRVAISREAEAALTRVSYAATQILAYTNLYAEDTSVVRYGRSYADAMRSYRDELSVAFRSAADDWGLGAAITTRARTGLLDHVLIPYDSLFGQAKDGGIRGFTSAAQASFVRWLRDTSSVPATAQPAVATVHSRWLEIVEAVYANLAAEWRDSRLVWLPLQLALVESDYDEQAEVDRLVERAIGRPWSDRNALTYLRSVDLPLEIARTIFATRDYHVLWTHDFTGRRDITKDVDEVAYTMVADVYLPALTRAVQRYDSAGTLPSYHILIDQFYYEQRDGKLWMSMLENPMSASVRLPGAHADWMAHLRERQQELQRAVAASRRLQADAARRGGTSWIRTVIKVNVNVVLPSDFSFRSSRIIPGLPFISDNLQRDHRKLAFYDLSASDPYRGAVIVTGVGIGEHYASDTWEDRGYRIRGPAALEVREAARRALISNGVPPARLPEPLRRVAGKAPPDGGAEYIGRALQLHNEVGFGAKESSVARAMLYNLAPPGSVMIVPDPLWVSETWAAMLAGAAARGCRVYVISPSLANGPNPQKAVVVMQHDVMRRLLDISRRLGPQIRAVGGELRVGLYTAEAEVTDAAARRREITEGLRRSPWIKSVIPFDSASLAVLNQTVTRTEAEQRSPATIATDERPRAPQLHQKTQLIARPGAIASLVRQSGWDRVLAQAMEVQSAQTVKFGDQLGWAAPDVDSSATLSADAMIRGYEQGLSAADRKAVSFYFSLGSQNQDPRGLMQDGEATVLVSGIHAAAGLVDLYYVMARSTWIEAPEQLQRLLPRPRGLMARIGRVIRSVL